MNWIRQLGLSRVFCTLALALVCATPARAAEYLRWDQERHRVEASVQTWDVVPLLQRVAAATKWQIYLQPGTKQKVPTRFRDLAEGEALRRLLGDLNFVIVPQSNAPARLYVFRTAREDATELIRAAELEAQAKAKRIEDELIVRLKPGESIEELAKKYGAKVTGKLDELNAYRLKFDDADSAKKAREALGKESSVASVDYNYALPRPETPESSSLAARPLTLQPKAPQGGKQLIIGLVDTAVQPEQGGLAKFLMDPIVVAADSTPLTGEPTHATGMAQTILNAMSSVIGKDGTTSAQILPVVVMGNNDGGSSFDVAVGIWKAIEAGANPINLSLSGTGDSAFLHEVIKSGYDQGVIFFAASGNEPVTTLTFPAGWKETTAVTALSSPGQVAEYANRSGIATAAAPGSVLITYNGQTYMLSGTSVSTAYATGVAAGLVDTKKVSPKQAGTAIQTVLPVPK